VLANSMYTYAFNRDRFEALVAADGRAPDEASKF
jgi:hypothetical protein